MLPLLFFAFCLFSVASASDVLQENNSTAVETTLFNDTSALIKGKSQEEGVVVRAKRWGCGCCGDCCGCHCHCHHHGMHHMHATMAPGAPPPHWIQHRRHGGCGCCGDCCGCDCHCHHHGHHHMHTMPPGASPPPQWMHHRRNWGCPCDGCC